MLFRFNLHYIVINIYLYRAELIFHFMYSAFVLNYQLKRHCCAWLNYESH